MTRLKCFVWFILQFFNNSTLQVSNVICNLKLIINHSTFSITFPNIYFIE